MSHSASSTAQRTFDSPEAAVESLIVAVRAQDRPAMQAIFGPDIARLQSGENRQDSLDFQRFTAAYDIAHSIRDNNDDSFSLVIGANDWVFPAPLITNGSQWHFDTHAGIDEVITRTVGYNELGVIETCAAFINAQQQFFNMDTDGDGVKTYASKFRSTPNKQDGLFWPDAEGQPLSPLGPLAAQAVASGDIKVGTKGPIPYRGYYFRILTSQGPGAPGGAKNYIDEAGRMTAGYAMIAWPAAYDETGVMSFIVSGDGRVYQRDLGEDSAGAAAKIMSFDPTGWVSAIE